MKHIVVVDDSKTIRMSIKIALKEIGHNIILAENGSDALNQINELVDKGDEIAICITDINMPEMDGMSLIKEFRKNDKFTPIITLTTESEQDMIKKGKEAGATGWMIKPFEPAKLIETVKELIK